MCTVTYLPFGPKHFILTSNRDETINRKTAEFPFSKSFLDKNIIYPRDGAAGGSWIAAADNHVVMCLLNGAFEKHKHQPPYKMSRGLMLMEAMECIRPEEFIKNFDFEGIEPFTLIMIYHESEIKLIEFRWDGKSKYITVKDAKTPAIWSSSTLYPKEVVAKREEKFNAWLKQNPEYELWGIRSFHQQTDPSDPENAFQMKRANGLQTVSTTSIEMKPDSVSMYYQDYQHPDIKALTLSIDS